MTPGDEAWIRSGLKSETAFMILGLKAKDKGKIGYQGQGTLKVTIQSLIHAAFA